ncbi:MAG: hypothetical protein Q7T23_00145 [Phenylobacterium sp.]|nr:hypothetical protein [Phenylobacterium sp.]
MKILSEDDRETLLANIERLASYTKAHSDLRGAHHFLYDLRHPAQGAPEYVIMGVNPGETEHDWTISPTTTEETSRYDFHKEVGPGRSAIRWTSSARFFLDDADYVLTELFFWSSRDSLAFRERYGKLALSPHLALCTELNRALIEIYQPRAVVLPGLGNHELCRSLYELQHNETVVHEGTRIVEHYTDGRRPWIFTKHWTASFGFSKSQRQAVLSYIRRTAT